MSGPTSPDGTTALHDHFTRAALWVPALVAVLSAIGIILLIVSGHPEEVSPVAVFGTSVFVGGTAATVTINIIRR